MKLRVEAVLDIPLREVSGLGTAHTDRGLVLVAVGDATSLVAVADLLGGRPGPWRVRDLGAIDGSPISGPDPQLEAVAIDAADRVFLLQEGPARVSVFDSHTHTVLAMIDLLIPAGSLAAAWREDASSRGEALVLLADGHLLVGKEKRPPVLLEFGPAGDKPVGIEGSLAPDQAWEVRPSPYELLASWALGPDLADALHDLSDAALGPDGRLYLLSDQSARLARVRVDGDRVEADAVWRIDGKPDKAEGLAFLPDGTALVALDHKHLTHNLLVLAPPIATG